MVIEKEREGQRKGEMEGEMEEGGRRKEEVSLLFVPTSTTGQSFSKLLPILTQDADPIT